MESESTTRQKTLKSSHNSQNQWHAVSTLCQEMKNHSYLQGKSGVEIRIESVNKDYSHSLVRISHGLNKFVTDLSNNKETDNNEQETSEMQLEDLR